MNDWQLLSAYVHGEEHAFDSLVQNYFPMVFSAALRQVNDRGLAEEIAQSVFILLSRKAAKLNQSVLLPGWLLRTTRFVARDALKQMNRREKREQHAAELAALSHPEDPAWAAAVKPLLDEALRALSGQEQGCVISRFILGRSFREIGDEFRITEDTAQKRVARSLDKLRRFLERRGLKVAASSIAGLLSVDLARAAEPGLIENALGAVKAAAGGKPAMGSITLANTAARALLWRSLSKIFVSAVAGIILVGGGGFLVWNQLNTERPAFQTTDVRIDALGRDWSRMAVLAAGLIRGYPQGPPPANDPSATAYQREFSLLNRESNRILGDLTAVLAGRPEAAQRAMLAQLLTVELRENVTLSRRQQTAVFAVLQEELRVAEGQGGLSQIYTNRAILGPRIRPWLSQSQRARFDYVYGEDCRGLFSLMAHVH